MSDEAARVPEIAVVEGVPSRFRHDDQRAEPIGIPVERGDQDLPRLIQQPEFLGDLFDQHLGDDERVALALQERLGDLPWHVRHHRARPEGASFDLVHTRDPESAGLDVAHVGRHDGGGHEGRDRFDGILQDVADGLTCPSGSGTVPAGRPRSPPLHARHPGASRSRTPRRRGRPAPRAGAGPPRRTCRTRGWRARSRPRPARRRASAPAASTRRCRRCPRSGPRTPPPARSGVSSDVRCSATQPVMPSPISVTSSIERLLPVLVEQLAAERDRRQGVSVGLQQVDPAVVVVDDRAQLGRDRLADLADVIEGVQGRGQVVQHVELRTPTETLAAGLVIVGSRSCRPACRVDHRTRLPSP